MEKNLFQLRALITYLEYVLREPAFLKKKLPKGSNISFNFELLAVLLTQWKFQYSVLAIFMKKDQTLTA